MEINPNVVIFCEDEETRESYIEYLIDSEHFELWFASTYNEFEETLKDFKQEGNSPAVCFLDLERPESEIADMVKKAWGIQKNLEFVIVSKFESNEWENAEELLTLTDKFVFCKRPQTKVEMTQFALSKCYKWSVKRQTEKLLLRLNQKIETIKNTAMESSKLRSIGEMTSSVAHEINNPLTVILTSCELINSVLIDLEGHEDLEKHEKLSKYNDKILIQADRIASVVKSMRNMAGRNDFDEPTAVKLGEIIRDFKNLCLKKMLNHNVELELGEFDKSIEILCHRSNIVQVFFNIIMNSIEVFEKEELDSDKKVEITFESNAQEITIHFKDNGPGIKEDVINNVFKPFYTTKSKEGKLTPSGLGLTLVQETIEKLNGTVEIKNRTDGTNGVHVIISLPIYQLNELAA